jgi:AcrR family transcriptional regulator
MSETALRRTRNSALTKERILDAAHLLFARSGYSAVGLREIATRAGVTSALIVRYFGTKAGLFEAALIRTIENNSVFTLDKARFGETMAALVREQASTEITAMLLLAMADSEVSPAATRILHERMIAPLADWLGPPHAFERAMNMFGLLTGFAVQARGVRGLDMPDYCFEWLAGTLQDIINRG